MIFLVVLSGKIIFLFPENMTLFFRRKMKDDLSQKIHGNMIFSSNARKDGLAKKVTLEYDLSCIIWKDGIVFPENIIFFLWRENER